MKTVPGHIKSQLHKILLTGNAMKGKRFDESRPYAELWGAGGLFGYEQEGQTFNPDGSLMGEPAAAEPEAEAEERTEPEEPEEVAPLPRFTYAQLSRKGDAELRTLVEIAGGTWSTRSRAIAYLQAAPDK
jgi:hypothetical protein